MMKHDAARSGGFLGNSQRLEVFTGAGHRGRTKQGYF